MIRRKRGVFFVGVLFLVVMVTMFVAASFELGVWGLKRTANQSDLLAAQRAARSGLDYALARLKNDPTWKGHSALNPVVNQPGLVVVEENGSVIGLIQNSGQASQFRIRFNFNDGNGGPDGMPDPSPTMKLGGPWVSINNLGPDSTALVPLADGSGDSVPATPTAYDNVPAHGVFLMVEGRVGDWLNSASAANPNPPSPAGAPVTTSRVESVYKVTNIGSGTPAVIACANSISATVASFDKKNNFELDSADNAHPGRLRTRGNLDVVGGDPGYKNLTSGKGGAELRVLGATGTGLRQATDVVSQVEAAGDVLLSIPWAQVKQAPATNTLPAGVYAFDQNGALHYYDMSLAQYNTHKLANPGDPGVFPVTLPASMAQTSSGSGASLKATLRIVSDTLVTATVATSDLTVIPMKGVDAGPGAPSGAPGSSQFQTAMQAYTTGPLNYDFPQNGLGEMIGPMLQEVGIANGNPPANSSWLLPNGGVINNLTGSNTQFGNFSPTDWAYLTPLMSSYAAANPSSAAVTQALSYLSMGAGASEFQEIPAVTDTANNNNVIVEFKPSGSSAVLTTPGNVNLGGKLKGDGASITSEGNINLVGLGIDLSAATNPNEGVSLYSKKNVFISTYDKLSGVFKDVALKGVVYCWGDFKANLGHSTISEPDWGKLKLTGAMIAYGKDPSDLVGPVTGGKIEFVGEEATLKYDPAYIQNVINGLPSNILLGRTRWIQL